MRKITLVISILIAFSMILSACAPAQQTSVPAETQAPAQTQAPTGPEFKSKDPTTYFRPMFGEPETLDPALDYETSGGEIVANVYETLVWYNKTKASEFIPQLAESWTVSEDGKTYTFVIRKGIKFHEGGDLEPHDVAYTFQRGLLQGGTASPQWLLTEPFFGVGVDDIAAVVGEKIMAKVDNKAVELLDAADLTKFDEKAFETLFTDLVTFYNSTSGFTVDAAAVLKDETNAAAVKEMIDGLKGAADDTARKESIKTTAVNLLTSAEGGDVSALYDDKEAMKKVDPAVLKETADETMTKVVADDTAGTVTMTLAQPWGPFLATIANNWGAIMDKEWVVEKGGWDGSPDTWQNFYATTADEDPFTAITNGTGPFKLDHWTKGEEIVLVRNDNYWRTEPAWEGGPTGPAKLERVVLKVVNEFGTRFAMFQAGDADNLMVGSQADYSQIDPLVGEECKYNMDTGEFDPCSPVGDGSGSVRRYYNMPQVSHTDVFFNFNISAPDGNNPYIGSGKLDGNGIPPDFFQDVHIRKAFNYCFDWDTYIKDAMIGEGVQTLVIPVAGMPGYDPNAPHYSYDPAKCEEEFKAADLDKDGIPAGDDPEGDVWTTGFRFQAVYNQGNTQRQTVAEILASDLASVNDKFVVEVLGLPWAAFLAAQRAKTLPIFISGWLEDIHDPHNWYQPYLTGTYGRRQSLPADLTEKYQELLNQGVSETDPAKRAEIYAKVNQLQYENPSLILLATPVLRRYEQRWVNGFYYNPIYSGMYWYVISKQ